MISWDFSPWLLTFMPRTYKLLMTLLTSQGVNTEHLKYLRRKSSPHSSVGRVFGCGMIALVMLAAKRLAGVTPEVNFWECVTCVSLHGY